MAPQEQSCDVLVYGATVAGIAAAIAAARMGCRTMLVERGKHLGGMTASGLGSIDTMRTNAFGGIFHEFLGRVRAFYIATYGDSSEQYRLTYNGFFMEPKVAERVLDEMLAETQNLIVVRKSELAAALVENGTVVGARFRTGAEERTVRAKVAIDGTYEGDLAAAAGVAYRVGREGRDEFGERYAGVIYYDWRAHRQQIHPASTGEASDAIQGNCFRVTLSDDPATRVPIDKPDDYADFLPLYKTFGKDCANGRARFLGEVLWINRLANRKYCINGHIEALTSLDQAEFSRLWPEAGWAERDTLFQRYVSYTKGFLWYLQNDAAISNIMRQEAGSFGLPADEYADTGHFPFQLYVRQGRRIHGAYRLTEADSIPAPGKARPPVHKDTISTFEHSFDSHAARDRLEPNATVFTEDGFELIEGVIWFRNKNLLVSPNKPATLPYRAMLPEVMDGLLVPCALSATNVAFSAIRMEPCFMANGHAAGVAAALAVRAGQAPRQVDAKALQRALIGQGQVVVYFDDLALDDPDFAAIQMAATEGAAETFAAAPVRAAIREGAAS